MRVRVVRADLESGRIDFVLAAQQPVRGENATKPAHKATVKQAEKPEPKVKGAATARKPSVKPAPKSSSHAKAKPPTRTKPVVAAKKRGVSKKHH